MGTDAAESRAGEAEAVRERDRAVHEKTEAETAAMQCDLATAQAMLEIEAGRREQATGAAGGGSASERMSQPGLACHVPVVVGGGGGGGLCST